MKQYCVFRGIGIKHLEQILMDNCSEQAPALCSQPIFTSSGFGELVMHTDCDDMKKMLANLPEKERLPRFVYDWVFNKGITFEKYSLGYLEHPTDRLHPSLVFRSGGAELTFDILNQAANRAQKQCGKP